MPKRTPLYEKHVEMKGKLVNFCGWELPIQYIGILEEHLQVRKSAGLFDVSHMGEITIKGTDAEAFIQKLITNDISKLKDKQVLYSPMCYQDGCVVDDLLVYRFSKEDFLLVVNAANVDKDFTWMQDRLNAGFPIKSTLDISAQLEQVDTIPNASDENTEQGQDVAIPNASDENTQQGQDVAIANASDDYVQKKSRTAINKTPDKSAQLKQEAKIANVSNSPILAEFSVLLENGSDTFAQLSLQGPHAERILQRLVSFPLNEMKYFYFEPNISICGINVLVSRTGYTGENGFELYVSNDGACKLWQALLDEGKEEGLMPIGLGARDTLRFEAALSLYGQELSDEISPLEAGLERFVKLDKEDFIGKAALAYQKQTGLSRKLVGFEMVDRGIPRPHFIISKEDIPIGHVTSGSFSPSLHKNIGLALVNSQYADIGSIFDVVIRNKPLKAKVIPIPFYDRKSKMQVK